MMGATKKTKKSKKPSAPERTVVVRHRPKPRVRGIEKAVSAAAGAGPAAALAGHVASLPLFLGFGAAAAAIAVGTVLGLDLLRPLTQAYGARLAERVAPGARSEEAGRRLHDKVAGSADAQRAVLEGVGRLLDSVAPEAAPLLADLTAEYLERPVDVYFRGTARLIAEMSAGEMRTLRELLARAVGPAVLDVGEPIALMYWNKGTGRPGSNQLYFNARTEIPNPERPGSTTMWRQLGTLDQDLDALVLGVISRLKQNGLATDAMDGGAWGVSDARLVWFEIGTARRLAALLAREM